MSTLWKIGVETAVELCFPGVGCGAPGVPTSLDDDDPCDGSAGKDMVGLDNINPEGTLEDFQLILRTHSQCHNFTTAERKAVTLTTRSSEYRGQDCSDDCHGSSLKRRVESVVRSVGNKHSWAFKNNCAQCVCSHLRRCLERVRARKRAIKSVACWSGAGTDLMTST